MFRGWFISGLLLAVITLWPAGVQAAAARNTTGGISLSPFLQNISIQPSDIAKSFNLTITNHTAGLQELDLSTHDFGSLNNTGGILLEGSNSKYGLRYGLTSWLSLGTDTVVLQPNESRAVLVTINNRASLQLGGHYGAVVASVNSLNNQSGNKVVINQQLLSLILVDKVGGDHYDLNLNSATTNGNWLHLPNTARLVFQNPGNVHVVPRGLVKLKSPTGTVIAQGIINSGSAFMLPESFREFYVPLTPIGKAPPLPGLYHIEVDFRYDGINRYAVKNYAVRFIDLGLYVVLAMLAVITWTVRRRRRKAAKKTIKIAKVTD
jgi:hypothetical protein